YKCRRIKGIDFKWHVMRIGPHQVAIKQLIALPQHKGGDIRAGGFNANLFPPAGKARRAAAVFEQRFHALIFFNKLGKHLLLPDFSSLIAAFVVILIAISMLAIKEPFLAVLPLLELLSGQAKLFLFYITHHGVLKS